MFRLCGSFSLTADCFVSQNKAILDSGEGISQSATIETIARDKKTLPAAALHAIIFLSRIALLRNTFMQLPWLSGEAHFAKFIHNFVAGV